MGCIDHEQGVRQLLHLLDAAQRSLHLPPLPLETDPLLLGQQRLLVAEGRLDLLEAIDRAADGLEVGHGATEPTVVHVEHPTPSGLLADCILGLPLGAHEEDVAPGGSEIAHELAGLLEVLQRLLQIDDVNTVALAEDVRLHLGVPPASLVTEVNPCLEQLLHLDRSHKPSPYRLENWKRLRAFGCPYFLRSTFLASRVRSPADFRRGRSSGLNSRRARAIPWRIAPA